MTQHAWRRLALAALAAAAWSAGGPAGSAARQPLQFAVARVEATVDRLVHDAMRDEFLPGAVFVLVKDGQVLLSKGFGHAALEPRRAVDPDRTIFRIGSITKALTGLAVVQLADRGRLDLHDDVNVHLEDLALPAKFAEPVRVRHLLTHTGGFDQIGTARRAASAEARPSIEQFLAGQLIGVRPPGTVATYDTYGITLAGLLVERMSGIPYAEYMRTQIFAPLGMTRAHVETPSTLRGDLAVGYGYRDGRFVAQDYEYYATTPASSVDATAADMARLLIAVLGDGANSHGRFLSLGAARMVRSDGFTNHPGLPGFAYGFWEDRRNGQRALFHGGTMLGYLSELYLLPEHGLGYFVAMNRDPEAGGPPILLRERLRRDLMNLWFPDAGATTRPTLNNAESSDRYAGVFASTLFCHTCAEGTGWDIRHARVEPEEGGAIRFWSQRWVPVAPLTFRSEQSGTLLGFRETDGRISHLFVGHEALEKLDEHLLDQVFGAGGWASPATPLTAQVFRIRGEWTKAAHAYESLASRLPADAGVLLHAGDSWLKAGRPAFAARRFDDAWAAADRAPAMAFSIAKLQAAAGAAAAAVAWLDRAVDVGFRQFDRVRTDPAFDAVRASPELTAWLKRHQAPTFPGGLRSGTDPGALSVEPRRNRRRGTRARPPTRARA